MYTRTRTILQIDLTTSKISKTELSKVDRVRFLGGRGVNAKLLWDHMKRSEVQALHPDNPLIFGTGILTGTTAPSSGRTTITCKGPLTNLYLKSSMGGQWGAELRYAGYDHLVVTGAAKAPRYIEIKDDQIELKDASHLWGLDLRDTDSTIKHDLGDPNARVAAIGPAGEHQVLLAGIICSVYHAAARGGLGAVMGSKRLKAIAVRGTNPVSIADAKEFDELALNCRRKLAEDTYAVTHYEYGTSGGVQSTNELGAFPAYNFRTGHSENIEPLTGQNLVEKGYLVRRAGCHSCTISCHRYVTIREGKYEGTYTGGPEYETMSALGAGTGVFDTSAVIKANELCNMYGLDTISTGSAIQWAMETYEKGILNRDDTDGLELRFGKEDAMIELVQRIAFRKGKIGNLLADGVKRAAEKVGKDSWKWAICNSKGLEQSRVDTRCAKGYALAFAVNPRGPDHLHAAPFAEFGASPEALVLIAKLTGDDKWATPYSLEYRPEIVRWHEDFYAVSEALGFCIFATIVSYGASPKDMANLLAYSTGITIQEPEIMLAGRRILTLEKCFNVRQGADRSHDDLPWRLMHEPIDIGTHKGLVNSRGELDQMLDRYYELHEWDPKTSMPYEATLKKLDLCDVAETLRADNRLPPIKSLGSGSHT